jgi:predicted lipoprotein with Yx(FWY)xxD motif
MRERGRYYATFKGCDHRADIGGSFAEVEASPTKMCPQCNLATMATGMTPDEWRRDEWKRLACTAVAHRWPTLYAAVVEDARGRARSQKPDHRLAGVADACEAAGVALHVALQLEPA